MVPKNMDKKIETVFKKYGVKIIYLFGSHVRGEKTPLSDVDVGIVFGDICLKNNDPITVFTELYEVFKLYLKIQNQKIDLVYLQETPLSLQMGVIQNGKVIYSESEEFRTDYEEYVMRHYMDWKYEDDLYNMEMTEAIYAGV